MADFNDDNLHDDEQDPGADRDEMVRTPRTERHYVIPAQDTKGHSARLQCRAQPTVVRLATDVLASKKFPFRVIGDLYRYCIVTQLKALAADAGVPSVLLMNDAIIEICRESLYQRDFVEAISHVRQTVDMFLSSNADDQARQLIVLIREKIDRMPEGYWKQKYAQEIKSKYGSLLDGRGGVILIAEDE